jgi:hypothetical protein
VVLGVVVAARSEESVDFEIEVDEEAGVGEVAVLALVSPVDRARGVDETRGEEGIGQGAVGLYPE